MIINNYQNIPFFFQVHNPGVPEDHEDRYQTLNVELSKEKLDTMLHGLGRIRDQLSAVAKKWMHDFCNLPIFVNFSSIFLQVGYTCFYSLNKILIYYILNLSNLWRIKKCYFYKMTFLITKLLLSRNRVISVFHFQ